MDGSHIRTLLLTFFFRKMEGLVNQGHLYIAQPPLYRVVDNKKEIYIKDEASMRVILLERACEALKLKVEGTGVEFSGQRLIKLMENLSAYLEHLERLKRRGLACPGPGRSPEVPGARKEGLRPSWPSWRTWSPCWPKTA